MAVQQQHSPRPGVGSELSQLSVGDMLGGMIFFAPLMAAVPLVLNRVRTRVWAWLVEHQLVVPTQTLTIFEGQGFDVYRILIVLGAAGMAAAVGYATIRRRHQRRLEGRR